MATGPVFDQGGYPRISLKGNLALRLDTGEIQLWNAGTATWGPLVGLVPTGGVIAYAGLVTTLPAAPAGFLLCNGLAVSRTTYARLFAVIGIIYGPGNGVTTFNLPNLVATFVQGAANDATLGAAGGAVSPGILDPGHTHGVMNNVNRAVGGPINTVMAQMTTAANTGITIPDGRPPFLDLHWLIKD